MSVYVCKYNTLLHMRLLFKICDMIDPFGVYAAQVQHRYIYIYICLHHLNSKNFLNNIISWENTSMITEERNYHDVSVFSLSEFVFLYCIDFPTFFSIYILYTA